MVRIIKEGQLPEKKLYQKACQHCKTQYEFERGEARYESSPKNESYLIINCPFCGKLNYFDLY